MKRTAWSGPCSSWFKGGKIEGTAATYPGRRIHFLRLLENPRYEDYGYVYEDENDIFEYMGSGFHVGEKDGSDITWYLGSMNGDFDEERLKEEMSGLKGRQLNP